GWKYVKDGNYYGWQKMQPNGNFHENPMFGDRKSHVDMVHQVKTSSVSRYEIPVPKPIERTTDQMIQKPEVGDMISLNGVGWKYVKDGNYYGWQKMQPNGNFHENPMFGDRKSHVDMVHQVKKLQAEDALKLQKFSDIEARKQAIRSRLGDNTNVLAELRKAEERIKNMSDEQVLKEAIGKTNKPDVVIPVAPIIPGISSKFETTQPPKNSSAETQKPTEAIDPVVAVANADAIGNRIADMAGKKDPEAGKILASGDSGKIKEALSSPSNWKKWAAIAGLLGLILLGLSQCHKKEQIVAGVSPEDVERDTPVPTAVDIVSPEATAIYCEKLANPVASSLNTTRSSAASENVILTEKRRENISKRWMQSSEWQNVLNEWNTNLINIPEDAQNMMKDVLITPSPENVRKLQQLIGMEAIDQAVGQDGILGTNTTREIGEYVNSCNVKPTLPLTPSA
ncbi:hypothetical protein KBB25_02350, partial [Candidatus Gracilibacteria bacterium]|nr:hypothetical protein [Candidatus Gracilibacteria bacterium]